MRTSLEKGKSRMIDSHAQRMFVKRRIPYKSAATMARARKGDTRPQMRMIPI
jgi:hypothetical protein